MALVALVGGIVGAKTWWALDTGIVAVGELLSGSGLTWYGGLLGGAAAIVTWARWRGAQLATVFGVAAVALPVGQAIGRVGCQVSGDGDYGRASSLPWAMPFPDGAVPTEQSLHPAALYESVALALLALVLWRARDQVHPAALFGAYLVVSGFVRFLIELVRTNEPVLAGLTAAQVTALALVATGAALAATRPGPLAVTQ